MKIDYAFQAFTFATRRSEVALLLCGLVAVAVPAGGAQAAEELSAFERRLIELPADTWYEAPNTPMEAVCAPPSFGVGAVMGCRGIIEAWGGGAYDSRLRKMLIWGGGHNDYWGNEVYAFDLRSGNWDRLTDPSPGDMVAASNSDPLPDGNPNSRHTYDGLQYIAHREQMIGQGGSVSPGGGGTAVTWLFDSSARAWKAAMLSGGPGGYGIASGYDPTSGLVIMRGTKGLWAYDADANQWQPLSGFGYTPRWPRYERSGDKSGAVDTRRQLFWSVGNNDYLVWDIRAGELVTEDWVTIGGGRYTNEQRVKNYPEQVFVSGGGDIHDAGAPGFDYDSKADQFVAWKGGAAYVLDLETRTWHVRSAEGAPPTQVRAGTFGRWRYLPQYNVFILVNSVSSNVLFYKNTPGGP